VAPPLPVAVGDVEEAPVPVGPEVVEAEDEEDEESPLPATKSLGSRVPQLSLMFVVQASWPVLFPTFEAMQSSKA